jgi:protein CpxP
MNKTLIHILLVLSFPLTVLGGQPEQDSGLNLPLAKGSKIERMTNDLGLDEAEKSKVEAIINDEQTKIKAFSNEERRRLQDVLTPEQIATFDAIAQKSYHK